jgi:hypothetical protein
MTLLGLLPADVSSASAGIAAVAYSTPYSSKYSFLPCTGVTDSIDIAYSTGND